MDTRLTSYVDGQWGVLVRYAAAICGDASEAEEIVQTVSGALPKLRTRVLPTGAIYGLAADPAGGVVWLNSSGVLRHWTPAP